MEITRKRRGRPFEGTKTVAFSSSAGANSGYDLGAFISEDGKRTTEIKTHARRSKRVKIIEPEALDDMFNHWQPTNDDDYQNEAWDGDGNTERNPLLGVSIKVPARRYLNSVSNLHFFLAGIPLKAPTRLRMPPC